MQMHKNLLEIVKSCMPWEVSIHTNTKKGDLTTLLKYTMNI